MIEGWHNDDYLFLFDQAEAASWSARYEIRKYLKGHAIVGLRSWDDFLVRNVDGQLATVPTVPLNATYITPLDLAINSLQLQPDNRFRGIVKWYITPLVFGGSPTDNNNIAWITLDQHVDLVKWWNEQYKNVTSQSMHS